MNIMKQELNNGKEINVISAVDVNNVTHALCELDPPRYIDDMLVKYVVLHPKNFKEFVEAVRKETEEITVHE